MENLIVFIEEKEYQIIKKESKKTEDFFNKKELQNIIRVLGVTVEKFVKLR